jgi:hypothetical protein
MVEENLEKELAVAEKKAESMLKEMERTEPKPVEVIVPKIEETLADTCEDRIGFLRESGKLDDYRKWLKEKKV